MANTTALAARRFPIHEAQARQLMKSASPAEAMESRKLLRVYRR
jgi:hypothetical protein